MEHLDRRSLLGVAGMVGVAALASRAGAGPLEPPVGPVGPTGRTLDELYERTGQAERYGRPSTPIGADTTPGDATNLRILSEPGHYHLTANLVVPDPYTTAILATAAGVTVDLNGFAILVEPGASATTAVRAEGVGSSVSNGYIAGFSGLAVDFANAESARVERVTFDRCGTGVWASDFAVVSRCTFHQCTGVALHTETGAIVTECTFKFCGGGVQLDQGLMERCTILTARRAFAVAATNGSIVRGCSINAATNDGAGADVSPVTLSEYSRMEHCVVTVNCRVTPLKVSGASVVAHCTLRNLTPDTSGGITQVEMTDASVMHDSLIRRADNGGGITAIVGSACVFKDNTVVGRGIVNSTQSGSPRAAVLGNVAFSGTLFQGAFDSGTISSPIHLATNSTGMPADFSAFGNVLGS
jgi:hypothetical protein